MLRRTRVDDSTYVEAGHSDWDMPATGLNKAYYELSAFLTSFDTPT